ncbi:MAG: zinc metalloprotease HtpX [Acidobacteriota bacterium]
MNNRLKTMMLLAALTALLLWIGHALAGQTGFIIALALALLMNFGSYWFSDKIILQIYHAQEVSEKEAPQLFAIVRDLANRNSLPMPKVYLIPEQMPNAFATGRNPENAAVAVTEGLLKLLNREEAAGVIGHELSHVKNRDTLIMTVAATIAGALTMLASIARWRMLLGGHPTNREDRGNPLAILIRVIIAPIAAALIQLAISRAREFMADGSGAEMTGDPLALASALRKIEGWSKRAPMARASPATAHMFIINPLTAEGLAGLFSTHPPTNARIERLENMAHRGMQRPAA